MNCVFLFSVIIALAAAEFHSIGFKKCKSEGAVQDVKAEGCNLVEEGGKKICLFKAGSKPELKIFFTPAKESNELVTNVRAKVGSGAMVTFPQADTNACNYGVKCPVVPGEEQVFSQSIEIANHHPKNEVIQVNWQINRPDENKEVCIIFLARIED